MSVLSKGKGRRITTSMLVKGVSVGRKSDGGLTLSFHEKEDGGGWVNVSLDKKDADALRSLVKTVDEMGATSLIDSLGAAREAVAKTGGRR